MTKHEVLALLRQQTSPLSGQAIAEVLGISRTAVWKAVGALQKEGYRIDSVPRRGYVLVQTTQALSAVEIQNHLGGHPWAGSVTVVDSVDSTNNLAKQLAGAGAPEGTCVLAERQTDGRGRRGRSFASPGGMGIYLSVILRPDARPDALMHLSACAAEAGAEAVETQTGLQAGIKWVNDLVAGGKKLSGILTELSVELESGRVQYAVVGIGVNCCQRPSDFPPELADIATSIAMQTGKDPDRNALAAELIRAISRLSRELLTERAAWMERYRARCVTLGKQVQVLWPDGKREAKAIGLNDYAALEVEYPDGSRATVSSGEVSVRGMYGYL